MNQHSHTPRLMYDDERAYIDVASEDADALRDYLFRQGIHGLIFYNPWDHTARLDVSDVGGEWAEDVLRHWKH